MMSESSRPARVLAALIVALVASGVATSGLGAAAASHGPAGAPVPAPSATPAATAGPSLAHRFVAVSLAGPRPACCGSSLGWLAYDASDGSFYVADGPSSVEVVDANFTLSPNVTATVAVGSDPFGVAYDNQSGDVFVTNSGSDNVSVLNGTQPYPIGSVSVGVDPLGVAYDPVDGDVYVANNLSNSVSVVDPTTDAVVANVSVGSNPTGVAANPATGDVYVANHGSANVSVLAPFTHALVTTLTTEPGPYGIAVDNRSGNVYVSDEHAANVTVINGTMVSDMKNISIPGYGTWLDLQGIVYDPADNLVWVAGGINPMVVLSPVNESLVTVLTFDPSGVAYDPLTGDICVTNTANVTFECAVFLGPPVTFYTVSFSEQGLPSGYPWSVAMAGENLSSEYSSGPIEFGVPNGTYAYWVGGAFAYAPTIGSASVTVAGSNVAVTVAFVAVTEYTVSIAESGLPADAPWSVSFAAPVNGSYASVTPWINLTLPNGSYEFTPYAQGFTPNGTAPTVVVAGGAVNVAVSFLSAATYSVTFVESGLPAGTAWTAELSVAGQSTTGVWISFNVTNGNYSWSVSAAGYVANVSSGNVTVDGSAVTVSVAFAGAPYTVTFTESGLPAGTDFAVTLAGSTETGIGSVAFGEPSGTYDYSVVPVDGYSVTPAAGSVDVEANLTVGLQFAPENASTYVVTFEEAGLPNATGWGVVIGSAVESSLTPELAFDEPNGTYGYVVLAVTGFSTNNSGTVVVDGQDVAVEIAFSPTAYPVLFVEFGLPNGSLWSVTATDTATGATHTGSSTTDAVTLELPNGTYSVAYALPAGYTATASGPVTVAGSAVTGGTIDVGGPASGGGSGGVPLGTVLLVVLIAVAAATVVTAIVLRHRLPPPPWRGSPPD